MNISQHKLCREPQTAVAERFEFDISNTSDVAKISVFTEFFHAQDDWTRFEKTSVHTVFQSYVWLAAWQKHIGSKSGVQPQIVVGYGNDGSVRFLLPLAIRNIGPVRILCYLGCEEASYQIGQYAPGFARSLTPERILGLQQQITDLLPDFDVVRFKRQPFEWQGIKNPFANFAHKTAPSSGYAITLNSDYQTLFAASRSGKSRGKILRCERKLATHGDVEYKRCTTNEEISRVLDIMFAQKRKRLSIQGITNFLERPGVQDFYRELCLNTTGDEIRTLGLHCYKCDDQVLAIHLSAPYRNIEFGLISSMSDGPLGQYSPGMHMLHHDIERLCNTPTKVYDLGVGAHNYKDRWADMEHSLFDCIIATSLMGYLYSFASRAVLKIKRKVKNSKFLWPVFIKFRARIFPFKKTDKYSALIETLPEGPTR